jgi:hypothetical protein
LVYNDNAGVDADVDAFSSLNVFDEDLDYY